MKTTISVFLIILLCAVTLFAQETSFGRVEVPDAKGRQVKAVLTFSDDHKAVEVQPTKGASISIPYGEIDKFSYEYTKKHRINEESIFSAAVGVGAIVMLTKSKSHWLQIDYHKDEVPRNFVLRMDKHDYLRILDAVKTHTGKDAEILGNADKR